MSFKAVVREARVYLVPAAHTLPAEFAGEAQAVVFVKDWPEVPALAPPPAPRLEEPVGFEEPTQEPAKVAVKVEAKRKGG